MVMSRSSSLRVSDILNSLQITKTIPERAIEKTLFLLDETVV